MGAARFESLCRDLLTRLLHSGMATRKSPIRLGRQETWLKLWGKARPLSDDETSLVFEEFLEQFVPPHMHKMFIRVIDAPKAKFGNRFFREDSAFTPFETPLFQLLHSAAPEDMVEAKVILPRAEKFDGFVLKGQARRTLRQLVIDDWQTTMATLNLEGETVYVFVEPKMGGCMIRTVGISEAPLTEP